MDKLTSYDICTKYGCLSRIFTLITYFIMLFVVILLLNIIIKNEKHKFGVLYENGKLESHWLTNEEINNKTR